MATDPATLRIFYDGGCGVCGACARWALARDTRGQLRFIGDPVGEANPESYDAEAFAELCRTTVVAWEPGSGRTWTRHRAVARVLDALPLGWAVSWPLKLPLLSPVFGLFYDAFAARRHRVSALLGMDVCAVPAHRAPGE